jgi:hypothetical protein
VKSVIKKFYENKKYHQNAKKKKADEDVKKKANEDGPQQAAADNVVQPNSRSKQVSAQWKQTLSEAGFSANKGMSASSLQNKAISTPSFPERYYNNFTLNNSGSSTGSLLSEMHGIY